MATFLRDRVQSDQITKEFGRLWNTGNYFFQDAVERHVKDLNVVYSVSSEPSDSTLVLSMSNFVSPSTDMTPFADYIERYDFERVVMIGAGAQSQDFNAQVDLTPGTKRFLRLLSERSVTIGVRGFYTARVLESMGINNVRVIGCPTIFWSGDRNFRVDLGDRACSKFAFNFTPSGEYRSQLSAFLREAIACSAQYVSQDENYVPAVGVAAADRLIWNAKYYSCGDEALAEAIRRTFENEIHFYSIEEWIQYLTDYDFVVGTRFHGNMAALQAGCAPLFLVHDSRTKELCDFLNLPSLNLGEFRGESFAELAALADYRAFNATYPARYDNYVAFLKENGLETTLTEPPSNRGGENIFDVYCHDLAHQLINDSTNSDLPLNLALTEFVRRSKSMRG